MMMTRMDVVDTASELELKAEALRAVATEFGDDFCTSGDPEQIAQAIMNRPKVYEFLWYVIFDLVTQVTTLAGIVDDNITKV